MSEQGRRSIWLAMVSLVGPLFVGGLTILAFEAISWLDMVARGKSSFVAIRFTAATVIVVAALLSGLLSLFGVRRDTALIIVPIAVLGIALNAVLLVFARIILPMAWSGGSYNG